MDLADAFRKLRQAWFMEHLKHDARPGEWETVEAEKQRDADNMKAYHRFVNQTEAIINGADRCVAPTCEADMDEGL